jgi:GntR family transcriptional regulator
VDLDPNGMDALYVQLAAVLRAAIESGEIIDRVPSAATLAQQYEVAKGTAERALVMLREEGVIASSLGRGYFVVKRR